jgi:4'-phosphopantetheinyl transferase EntD
MLSRARKNLDINVLHLFTAKEAAWKAFGVNNKVLTYHNVRIEEFLSADLGSGVINCLVISKLVPFRIYWKIVQNHLVSLIVIDGAQGE